MRKKTFIPAIILGILVSCNNLSSDPKPATTAPAAEEHNCYEYINNKDTVTLNTININGLITGNLTYNFYQKDKNKGTIHGKLIDSLLVADYTFMSEGITSVRQVAFKKNKDVYTEGYGETEEVNGKSIFKNIDSLNFKQSILLNKIDCQQ